MTNSFAINKSAIKVKTITTVVAIIISVVLPQIFHAIGLASGLGASVGAAFLPMHLPVLLAGFIAGPIVGVIAGIISPLLSFGISGMPTAVILPFIMLELAGYGLAAGLLSKLKMPVFTKLLIAQVTGRAIRAIAVLVSVYGFGNQSVQVASIWNMVVSALLGILLQWAFIPLLMYRLKGMEKLYE